MIKERERCKPQEKYDTICAGKSANCIKIVEKMISLCYIIFVLLPLLTAGRRC